MNTLYFLCFNSFCFVNIFLENVGKKTFTVGVEGVREGRSGYSKHNFFFFFFFRLKHIYSLVCKDVLNSFVLHLFLFIGQKISYPRPIASFSMIVFVFG